MNRTIFWRLFWKEYRLQRALWIAMAVLTTLVLLLVHEFSLNPKERVDWLYRVALAFSALYCLGCGATLFAGEHEAATYEFQRTLPVGGGRVFLGKIAFALISSAALFGAMWFLAEYFNGGILPDTQRQIMLWELFGLLGLEMLLWTTLFSLLFRHVLVAAIFGGAAAAGSIMIVVEQISPNFSMVEHVAATVPRRAIIAALVALLDFWLGVCWFRGWRGLRMRSLVPVVTVKMPPWTAALTKRFYVPRRKAILGRLLWQHWRQSARMMAAVGVLLVPLVACAVTIVIGAISGPLPFRTSQGPSYRSFLLSLAGTLALLGLPLLGACAFMADQRRRSFRFLTERGVPPKYIWLSRQSIAFAIPLFVAAAVVLVSLSLSGFPEAHFVLRVVAVLVGVFGYVVVGVAVGQLCSMFIGSAFLAGFFSVLFGSLVWGWCTLMMYWGVNWLWSVLPIPIVLLLATRLRAPYWLLERNDLRAWLPAGLALVVPTIAILTAVLCYRVYQIPLVDPGFSPEEYIQPATAEEKATLALYKQAIEKSTPQKGKGVGKAEDAWTNVPVAPSAPEIAWADANQKAIALAIKASQGKLSYSAGDPFEQRGIVELARLLLCNAASLERKGKLDAALDQYLAAIRLSRQLRNWDMPWFADRVEILTYARLSLWATRSGQTPKLILRAARQLEGLTADISPSLETKLDYLRRRRFLEGDLNALGDEQLSPFAVFWLRLPWEHARALRVLNRDTRSQLNALLALENTAKRGSHFSRSTNWSTLQGHVIPSHQPPTWTEIVIYGSPFFYDTWLRKVNIEWTYTAMETSRRAVRLILALESWKLKHGSLPKTLDELVGQYLDRIPADPYSGVPFRYFRDGLKIPLQWGQMPIQLAWGQFLACTDCGNIAPNVPFIWAAGAKIEYAKQTGSVLDEYRLSLASPRTPLSGPRRPNSEYELWSSGWPFPIP